MGGLELSESFAPTPFVSFVCPTFVRDKEAPRPAWHIEIKYGWQAALLGPGEFLALLDDPFGANLQDRRGSRSSVHGSPDRDARRRG